MIRFAIPPIGGKGWFGGWNYMANLVRALAEYGDPDIETLLFIGPDRADDSHIADLPLLPRTRLIVDPAFSEDVVRANIARTLLSGRNAPLLDAFRSAQVDIAFAPAIYLGWKSDIPSIAWFPDFQHRRLPHMFSRAAWWKRDLGFRAQVKASAAIMLSSKDAENDCNSYYPSSVGKTEVARFAVPVQNWIDPDTAWQLLRSQGVPDDFIFLPNQLWQHKNHMLAVEAAGILAKRGSPRIILATGHGDDPRRPGYRAEIDQRIDTLNASANIKFLGSVEHKMVQALMIGATAMLNPSRFEGWSTTVEEAKGVGTPMLLSNLPVHKEQAPDAQFFDVDDDAALAYAVEAANPRSLDDIKHAIAAARPLTLLRQREFAQAVSGIVKQATQ